MERFDKRKKDVLLKTDKSSAGKWDERVINLCNKINMLKDYYTTSSCSGRIVIMKDQKKKGPNLFRFVSHDRISINDILNIKFKGNLKFKSEPPIFHIACRDLNSGKKMLNLVRKLGWKRSGIISLGKNIVLEIIGTEKLEFPLTKKGKLLVEKEFLKEVVKKANENLEYGWGKIKMLKTEIDNLKSSF